MNKLKDIFTPETRSYLYRVSIAVIALLAVVGIVSQELLPAVIGLAGAIFAISVADGNVPNPEEQAALNSLKKESNDEEFTSNWNGHS